MGPRIINVIDVERDGSVSVEFVIVGADAAQHERRGRADAGAALDGQIGGEAVDVLDALDVLPLDHCLRQGRDRDGDVLRALLALARGDDDVLEAGRLIDGWGRHCPRSGASAGNAAVARIDPAMSPISRRPNLRDCTAIDHLPILATLGAALDGAGMPQASSLVARGWHGDVRSLDNARLAYAR